MCITNKKKSLQFTYHLNNLPLEWVDTYTYLGVKVHKKLNWENHIAKVSHKATTILNLLRRTMYSCSWNARRRAYVALVRPHLEYCSLVWSPYQQKYIDTLEKVQKRAARWVLGVCWDKHKHQWSQHYLDSCSDLKLLTLQNRRRFLTCRQTFRIMHDLDCIKFKDYFKHNTCRRQLQSHSSYLFIPHLV